MCNHQLLSGLEQSLEELDFLKGLWHLAKIGDYEKVNFKLKNGYSANCTDKYGYTPLHYAARAGHVAICQVLIQYGANVNAVTTSGSVTALHRSCYMGHTEVTRLLLLKGADTLLIDSDLQSCLHKAAENNREAVVTILINHAKHLNAAEELVNIVDRRGKRATDLATNINIRSLLSNF